MSKSDTVIAARHQTKPGTLQSYTIGFILSIILTLIPFYLVINKTIAGWALIFTLLGFAIGQLLVQLQFFIHLGHESKPRWNLMIFLSMTLVLFIVVGGSLWIMHNLNYHMMPTHHMEEQLIKEEGIHQH